MESDQRGRLFWAMMAELAAQGYRKASVAGPIEAAGISSEEFEVEFGDKDGCLFAAYEQIGNWIVERATADCDSGSAWPERIRTGLGALLEAIAANPEIARAMTRHFPGIRPATYERYVDLLSRFVPYMREGREHSSVDEELPAEVELLAVGAAEAIIFGEIDSGRAERLPEMLPEILFSVLVPFMGPDRAGEEMRSAAAAI